ncbi:hypothetical protein Q4Q52_20030 [Shewanella sp. SP1S2-4]|uniref:hypothetical protein n=1 Tax=Shewanella sp. SP1S2-4 TaxID=3063537 RepID=UPI00288DE1C7|nr:hypothetical protein [Shewanella sp. SP1S2-4]MDT3322027.1 hypothetical protein [Shewanella sp. SP1S2-4]
MLDEVYLGKSVRDYNSGSKSQIEALAKESGGYWVISDSFKYDLPPNGTAFAYDFSLRWIKSDQLITFKVQPNSQIKGDSYDQFVVDPRAKPVRCILDYRKKGGMEFARYQCLEVGFSVDAIDSEEVIIAISDEECLVVHLTLDQATNRYVSRSGTITVSSLNPMIFKSDRINERLYEVPDKTVLEALYDLPWKFDQDLLSDLLDALRKSDSNGLSKNKRDELVSVFTRAKNLADEHTDMAYLAAWLPSFCNRLDTYVDVPIRIAETLTQIEPVKQQLEETRCKVENSLREELEPHVRLQLEDSHHELKQVLEDTRRQLKLVSEELISKKEEAERLEATLTHLGEELLGQIQRLNPVLGVENDLVDKDFEQLLNGLRSVLGDYARHLSPRYVQIPPWSLAQVASTSEHITFSQIPERLNKVARDAGILSESMSLFDTGARSGALVILPQVQAEVMVQAYARAVSRGDFVRVPLGPSVLQLDDLWVHPAKDQPTGFAYAWLEAENNPDQVQLVWLDGLHRSPMDLWLPSLIGVLHSDKRPTNLLVVASIEHDQLDADRVWKELPRFSFPIVPKTQPCGLKQFSNPEQQQVTSICWSSGTNIAVDKDDLDEVIDLCDPTDYFELRSETALYRALAMANSSDTPVSEQLDKTVSLRDQGLQWLKGIIE